MTIFFSFYGHVKFFFSEIDSPKEFKFAVKENRPWWVTFRKKKFNPRRVWRKVTFTLYSTPSLIRFRKNKEDKHTIQQTHDLNPAKIEADKAQ